MSKDIREFLKYYLGCDFWTPNSQGNLNAKTLHHVIALIENGVKVQLLLRKLESMTDSEAIEIYNIRGGQSLTDESKAFQIKEQLCGYRFYSGVTNLSGNSWAAIFHYLLSRGFWLFGNDWFDEGYIIDKATVK